MCSMTSHLKHFIRIRVNGTGLKPEGDDFFGTEMMVVALRHVGTTT